ncbi:MAG TPA: enoyl-CoA hydratase/isomerase family protein [Stellaceae bacterium]|nr:enoyl-CoA hydratase/isomerase family protein [Stellaceae bacterium]
MESSDEAKVTQQGRLGVLTLDRPQALNALTLEMIETLDAALRNFAQDAAIDAVLIRSTGDRAFCAGGDIKPIAVAPPGPTLDRARRAFFAGEYALNYWLHVYPKPVLTLMHGITMGGGCGLAMNAQYRIATERSLAAMPETMLGLFPDVGATLFLNELPGEMGLYLGLTGTRLRAGDLVALGMATHYVAGASVPDLVGMLAAADPLAPAVIDSVLARVAADPEPPVVISRQGRIDALFAGASLGEIVAALEAAPEDWAQEALASLRGGSPTSVATTFRQLRGCAGLPPAEVFRMEYRLAVRLSGRADFREGVRAVLVDKDRMPRWLPATLEKIDPDAIESLFAPLAPAEPELDLG